MTNFPSRMFRWAAIYGVIVLTPMYFTPLPELGAEVLLGFVGLALVFQGVFWVIGSDPVKYRALMLFAQGYPVPPPVAVFAAIDLALGLGFLLAWRRTPAD